MPFATAPDEQIAPRRARAALLKPNAVIIALLLAMTLIARAANLGNPDYHVDETFYLLVGNAMHHGAVPYVDIWDRKPPGLFAFYWVLAGIAPSVLSYQIAAIGFVTATAWLIVRIASRWADRIGAVLAGVLSIAWLQPLLGGGGQAPVFYNLFVVAAVLLLVRRSERGAGPAPFGEAVAAALLCGIAVTFKPTAVFEGTFVVLAFAAIEWNRTAHWRHAALLFAAMGAAAALPTCAFAGWYALHGQFHAYAQATIESNFHKSGARIEVFWVTVRYLAALTFLLVAGAVLGLNKALQDRRDPRFSRLMLIWLAAALAGFLAVPNFYSHYALPLVPLLAVLSAPYLSTRPTGLVLTALSVGWALSLGQSFQFAQSRRATADFDRIVSAIRANMPTSRLYVFDGSPWLYPATGARLPSRFVFPEHLMMRTEAGAIGVDPIAELTRVLSAKPEVVVLADFPRPDGNPRAFAVLRQRLNQDYTLVCRLPAQNFERPYHVFIFATSKHPDRSSCLPGETGHRGTRTPRNMMGNPNLGIPEGFDGIHHASEGRADQSRRMSSTGRTGKSA